MAVQQTLKTQFFVTRQNGALVPLIAMDELPIHVQIEGVSRSLSVFDTAGMTGVGVYEARHEYHVISSMNNTRPIPLPPAGTPQTPISNTSPQNSTVTTPLLRPTTLSSPSPPKTPDVTGNQPSETSSNAVPSSVESDGAESKSSQPTTQSPSPRFGARAHTTLPTTTTFAPLEWRNTAAPLRAASNATPPADPVPDMPPTGQKVYCSYWLRNGECNFAQQGCMYKHVMPLKLEVLEALGFRDLPDWYRNTYNVGSLRVNGGRNGLSYGILDGNKPTPPAKRVPEATKHMLASQLHALPGANGRGGSQPYHHTNSRHSRGGGNHRRPRTAPLTTVDIAKARAAERDRRDERLAAAFAADMDSELGDMMDAQMQKIREREQAGWEEEQEAARKAAVEADEQGESSETGPDSKEGDKKKTVSPAAADAPTAAAAAVANDEQKPRHVDQHKADQKKEKTQRLDKPAQSKAQRQVRRKA